MKKKNPPLPDHQDCEMLTGITLDAVPRDGSLGRARSYRKGADIWRPDDRSESIFFLVRGQVAIVSADHAGHEFILGVIAAGEPFGELCFCKALKNRETFARAVIESEALEIKLDDFTNYLQEHRDALTAFIFTFCTRLSDCQRRLEVLGYRGAEERLGRLLLHLAATRGINAEAKTGWLEVPINHDELAQMAAMSRPHVTVTMGKLRRRGLVQYQRNSPLMVNVATLTAYLGEQRS